MSIEDTHSCLAVNAATEESGRMKGGDRRMDIHVAKERYRNHPILSKATRFLADFQDEVDGHSDGWAYWRAPVKAAHMLMALIESGNASEAEYKKALGPIRSFYTRKGNAAGMEFPNV